MNIIMIGATGSGKSSFLRTFATALTNGDYIKDIYRVCPNTSREDSATKQVWYNKPDWFKLQLLKHTYLLESKSQTLTQNIFVKDLQIWSKY